MTYFVLVLLLSTIIEVFLLTPLSLTSSWVRAKLERIYFPFAKGVSWREHLQWRPLWMASEKIFCYHMTHAACVFTFHSFDFLVFLFFLSLWDSIEYASLRSLDWKSRPFPWLFVTNIWLLFYMFFSRGRCSWETLLVVLEYCLLLITLFHICWQGLYWYVMKLRNCHHGSCTCLS